MPNEEVLFNQTELVLVTKLKAYDKNPRKGNVKAIAESLETNSQYRPIVVQKSTNKILAGNHTWMAAKSLGWKRIACVFVDVDDEQAKKIVLADNRTNDLAEYDDKILAELLNSLTTVSGTGYSESDMEAILASSMNSAKDVYNASEEMEERDRISTDAFASLTLDSDDDDDDDDGGVFITIEPDEQTIESANSSLGGVIQLAEWIDFSGSSASGAWDFPKLVESMLITELPENLKTWAGSATRDDDHDGYWLYNWGIDSTSGMKDLSKICVSFYTHDDYFQTWWDNTARNTGKLINTKVKYAIMPNFSTYGSAKAISIFNNYKSWYVARYFQEAGIKVMPDMECRPEEEFIISWRKCLPKQVPWVACQLQNLSAQSITGVKSTEQDWLDEIRLRSVSQIKGLDVENFLIYAPTSKWDFIKENWARKECNLHFMPTRIELLAKRAIEKGKERDARGF